MLVVVAAIPFVLDPALRPRGRPARTRLRSRSRSVLVFGRQLLGPPAHAHRCRSCGASTRCTTASSRWTGSRRAASTRSTQAFTQAFTVLPLFLLGYGGGVFAGVAVFITLLALFQHANVRLRFPVLRWVINTPEWHHWHHAIDDRRARQELRPAGGRQDLRHRVPAEGRAADRLRHALPGPADGYLRHLAYPFIARGEGEWRRLRVRACGSSTSTSGPRPSRRSKRTSRCRSRARPTGRSCGLNMISSVDGGTAVSGRVGRARQPRRPRGVRRVARPGRRRASSGSAPSSPSTTASRTRRSSSSTSCPTPTTSSGAEELFASGRATLVRARRAWARFPTACPSCAPGDGAVRRPRRGGARAGRAGRHRRGRPHAGRAPRRERPARRVLRDHRAARHRGQLGSASRTDPRPTRRSGSSTHGFLDDDGFLFLRYCRCL